jgi:hypothetical protein
MENSIRDPRGGELDDVTSAVREPEWESHKVRVHNWSRKEAVVIIQC